MVNAPSPLPEWWPPKWPYAIYSTRDGSDEPFNLDVYQSSLGVMCLHLGQDEQTWALYYMTKEEAAVMAQKILDWANGD